MIELPYVFSLSFLGGPHLDFVAGELNKPLQVALTVVQFELAANSRHVFYLAAGQLTYELVAVEHFQEQAESTLRFYVSQEED
jgi:hypothetical protein